jgi:hypothetical protein
MGIRIEEWPDDKIKAMHKLFLEVAVTTNLFVGCPAALLTSHARDNVRCCCVSPPDQKA